MESTDSGGHGGGEGKFKRAVSTRTLTDVIEDEGTDKGDGDGGGTKEGIRSWRNFKEKIRSQGRRGGGGATWTSSVAVPASDVPIQTSKKRVMFRHASGRVSAPPESDPGMQPDITIVPDFRSSSLRRNSSGRNDRSGRFDSDPSPLRRLQEEEAEQEAAAERAEDEKTAAAAADGAETAAGGEDQPVKMSLMSLLAESDDEYGMEDDEEEDEDEDDGGGATYNNCCVCMVRHKGTAFEPCGHSFCRLCSREMWVQGGNCPLCNNYVLEILDVF